ncbi:phosphohistidine phosphatase SixA [Marinomonas sp. M1K-6]|uniref:Phosphohistidine phosphatase SixA n=1 Tax=Marinomonas profundi TaxID=2726122 RepID=A0A847R2Y4_9GAMM|nr:phosphohistidine phosphatase SixA [Marinomonas profundi]NLQ16266.1 phosphohistidine phosphatase SixA [Marinomonas profundi]UDV03157.1 phosphohistidine phosphatase SixA [Marinomonas profundi]
MKKRKRLYVLRHGNAQPYGYDQDERRELTELGVAEVKVVAQAFKAKSERFDVVMVSPYIRAQQTAKVFLADLDVSVEVKECSLITPNGREMEVALWLSEQPYESILLVTHQPFAHQFIDFLVDEPLPVNFAMTTATLAAVEGDFIAGACCQFRWHLSPL